MVRLAVSVQYFKTGSICSQALDFSLIYQPLHAFCRDIRLFHPSFCLKKLIKTCFYEQDILRLYLVLMSFEFIEGYRLALWEERALGWRQGWRFY